MERDEALKATLLSECLHAANVARRERDIFFGNIVTGKVPCSCDQPLIHSSLSKPNETHWAIQRKRGRIKRRGKRNNIRKRTSREGKVISGNGTRKGKKK